MAHFYGDLQGNRGEATRLGSAKSGIGGHIRGWRIGAKIWCYVDDKGNDCVNVDITGGSSNSSSQISLGTWTKKDGKIVKV